jgi:hypothetical protein
LTDYEIIHPVARGAERDAVRAIGERPDFRDDDPGAGAPGIAEVDDEELDHGGGGLAGGRLGGPIVLVLGYEDGDDYVAGEFVSYGV